MKNLIAKASAAATLLFLNAGGALAQGGSFFNNPNSGPPPDAVTTETLGTAVTRLINYVLGILGLIAVAFIIYAGILMVTGGGNDDQLGKAKKIITWSAIGIVIILLAWTIVTFVTNALG